MTLTFDRREYGKLLAQYQPRLIKTETENEEALAIVEELMHRKIRSPEENALYDLLVVLIEKFEENFYHPGEASNPHSMLSFLMEQQAIALPDLADVLGSEDIVQEILDKRKAIDAEQAKKLAVFFQVDASVFL
ncbi:MAG: transcriptional regulator [Cyanobacteria bacterium SBLK]|nr:transcriptional regulator [Cyanobacteria bacterium SBLK]